MLITEKSASRRQFTGSFSVARNHALFLILILVVLAFASPVAAQDRYENSWFKDYYPQGRNHPGNLPSDPILLSKLRDYHFSGNWGGRGCVAASTLKEMVDEYLATPNPAYSGVGSSVPGVSVAWYSPQCGTFTYAVGLQNIEHNVPLTPATPMGIGSMTKLVIAALTLRLEELGWFGSRGLDTPASQFLTPAQIKSLTVGDDPSHPQCPGVRLLYNREVGDYELTHFDCPDLSKVTLRNLLTANHGMYDFIDETYLPDGTDPVAVSLFSKLMDFLGIPHVAPPTSTTGLGQLKWYGLQRDEAAIIGGNVAHRDFELSFGNTGYQLLGVLLEQRTGLTLDQLVKYFITGPLHIEDMHIYSRPDPKGAIANGYDMYIDDPSDGDFPNISQVYPLASFNGYSALNTLSIGLGSPANVNLGGGAGGLVATPRSYAVFLRAFIEGGLLGPRAQRELNNSYVSLPDVEPGFSMGFGLQKIQIRNEPGSVDFDEYQHFGSDAGIQCLNAEIRRLDNQIAPAAGAMCFNVRRLIYPDQFVLWNNLKGQVMGVIAP